MDAFGTGACPLFTVLAVAALGIAYASSFLVLPKIYLPTWPLWGRAPLGASWLITTFGRIPSIISSTFVAGCVREGNYTVALVVGATTAALALAGMLKYRGFAKPEA